MKGKKSFVEKHPGICVIGCFALFFIAEFIYIEILTILHIHYDDLATFSFFLIIALVFLIFIHNKDHKEKKLLGQIINRQNRMKEHNYQYINTDAINTALKRYIICEKVHLVNFSQAIEHGIFTKELYELKPEDFIKTYGIASEYANISTEQAIKKEIDAVNIEGTTLFNKIWKYVYNKNARNYE